MHGEGKIHAVTTHVVIWSVILIITWDAYIEKGILESVIVLVASVGVYAVTSMLALIIAVWISYLAGFHNTDHITGWRALIALFIMPIGYLGIPAHYFLSDTGLRGFLPEVMYGKSPKE